MPFLRPLPMARVGFVALKDDREKLLTLLHDLGVLQVESVSAESLTHFGPERSSERQRSVGESLVRFRALLGALPARPVPAPRSFANLDAVLAEARGVTIDGEVAQLKREEDQMRSERKSAQETSELLGRFDFYSGRLEWLSAKRLLAFFGEAKPAEFERLTASLPENEAAIVSSAGGDTVRFIVAARRENADAIARLAQGNRVQLVSVPELSGPIAEARPKLLDRIASIDAELGTIDARLGEIATKWYPTVAAVEEALSIEQRKFDLFNRLGASERTFAIEGWIPVKDRARMESALTAAAGDRVAIYDLATTEEPPTFMHNPTGVRFYEFFIRFYSLPQASEWDPTWIFAIAFPIFFGLMLGDVGYGLVILGFSLWMIAGFPGRQHVPAALKNFLKLIVPPNAMRQIAWTLLPATIFAIALGFVFNSFFGFRFLPGPPLLDPTSTTGLPKLLLLAGYIGLAMVTVGFLLGGLKEYFHHHLRAALGKFGGIGFAWGISLIGLALLRTQPLLPTSSSLMFGAWTALVAGAVLLLFEGFEGVMQFMEIISHILSYTRLVGILLASVILASVIDQIAVGLFGSGAVLDIFFGLVILVGGQIFNLVLGVFEPGIQGARLIFVEQFSKFYTGNGKAFRPFGSGRKHTMATPEPASKPTP